MANLAEVRYIKEGGPIAYPKIQRPVGASAKLYEGAMVSLLVASGYAVRAGTSAAGRAVGVSEVTVDNSTGAAAALSANLLQGPFWFANSTSTDLITTADVGKECFVVDDQTVARTSNGGARVVAGTILEVDATDGVLVFIGILHGAALEGSPATYGCIPISLYDLREVTSGGDVGNIAANGGLLASDTTPILRGDAAETQEVAWAAANADIVAAHFTLPPDFDGAEDVLVELFVYTDNAGGGGIEAATFTVETGWDGGALVSDAATDTTPAVTMHKTTATIAAADIPDAPSVLTLTLTPGTHANDPIQLLGGRILYRRKVAAVA